MSDWIKDPNTIDPNHLKVEQSVFHKDGQATVKNAWNGIVYSGDILACNQIVELGNLLTTKKDIIQFIKTDLEQLMSSLERRSPEWVELNEIIRKIDKAQTPYK